MNRSSQAGLRDKLRFSTNEETRYVETTGSDLTGDGTVANPFASIDAAAKSIPEDVRKDVRIILGSGTFNLSNTSVSKLNTAISTGQTRQYFFLTGTVNELLPERTANSGTRSTLTDTGAFAGQDYSGKFVELLAGPNCIPLTPYYWFTNLFPIESNTDDTITFGCYFSSLLSSSTHYRIVENATKVRGDGTNTDLGTSLFGPPGLEFHVQSIEFTRAYFGLYSQARLWVQGCSFIRDTVGYAAVMNHTGGFTIVDGSYISGAWSSGGIVNNFGGYMSSRQNRLYNGKSAFENDSGNHLFIYGCKVDTMSQYGFKAVNSGKVKGSDNMNTPTKFDNCALAVGLLIGGGCAYLAMETGSGNANIAKTIGFSHMLYNSTKMSAIGTYTFNDASGTVTDRGTGTLHNSVGSHNMATVATTDATPTQLFTVAMAEGQRLRIEVELEGQEGDTNRLYHKFVGLFYRAAAGNVQQQGVTTDIVAIIQSGAWGGGTLAVDVPNQSVDVFVTGLAATNITWTASITYKVY